MKQVSPGFSLCVLLVLASFVSGCASGGGSSGGPGIPIITPGGAFLLAGQTVQFTGTLNGTALSDATWTVSSVGNGTPGTISASGLYTAPTANLPTSVLVTLHDPLHQTYSAPATITFFQPNNVQPGTVTSTANPLVASYNFMAPQGASVKVQFGASTNYGLTTWVQPAPAGGGTVSVLVAGMRASSTYHMQAILVLPDGTNVFDTDKTFTTGALAADLLPSLNVQPTPGLTPAPGVEMLSLFEEATQTQLTAVVTDLSGNVIWYYPIQPSAAFPMKLLPNGHILIIVSAINTVQEIDLAGNIISQTSLGDLDQGLVAAGNPLPSLYSMHHDMVKLANGHLMLLVNYQQASVLGDALIEWDPVAKAVVWTWSTFDHLSLSHAPNGTADWTHANAVVYSPDDGNIILSMRNQNWIIKINYKDGAGDGSILWHFGPEGDFTLPAGQAPIEWNYGQHYPTLVGTNSSGVFPMMFFNNGNNRLVDASDDVCGTPGHAFCYSSIPTFQLNEYTNTAEVLTETFLTPAYSVCCGDALLLPNGNLEADIAYDVYTPNVSYIREYTQQQTPQVVWQMNITGQLAYRGFRIPSMYPGVSWSQDAIATANTALTKPTAVSAKQ